MTKPVDEADAAARGVSFWLLAPRFKPVVWQPGADMEFPPEQFIAFNLKDWKGNSVMLLVKQPLSRKRVMTKLETNESGRKAQPLPQLGLHVVVHCPGYSCLGYLDADGTWKNAFSHETLPGVIGFSLLN